MNPENMKQYNELLWLGVPKKDRDSVRGQTSTRYIDPAHVCAIELTVPPWDLESTEVMPYVTYVGDDENHTARFPRLDCDDAQSVLMPTDYLRKILDNIKAEEVSITVAQDFPMTLHWRDGPDEWRAIIAPRVRTE
jgi:hypothetical protein